MKFWEQVGCYARPLAAISVVTRDARAEFRRCVLALIEGPGAVVETSGPLENKAKCCRAVLRGRTNSSGTLLGEITWLVTRDYLACLLLVHFDLPLAGVRSHAFRTTGAAKLIPCNLFF